MHDRPIEDADHVYVTIEAVEVFRVDEGGKEIRETVSSTPGQYDLLELQHGIEAIIGEGQFEPGRYKWIRLIVAKDSKQDIRRLPADALHNYIVIDGEPHPLRVPTGQQKGIKLGKNFEIEAGETTVLTLDFDVRQSVHRCGRKHVYRLKPRIRVVPTTVEGDEGDEGEGGVVSGMLATTDGSGLPGGTVVSAQQGGVEIASAQPDPVTGAYAITLEDGTYDLVVIAPGYDYASETGVSASDGHDFALTPASTGAIYGYVSPAGEDVTVRLLWNGFVVATVGADPSTGEYVFDNVPAGDYTVEASDGGEPASGEVTVSGGSASPLDFEI
jgi:hypothetical protein